MRRSLRFLWPALLLLPLAACMLAQPMPTPEETFRRASTDFMLRLRWQDYQGAARFFTEPRREAFLAQFAGLRDLHITDVQLESAKYVADERRMESILVVEYYLLPSPVVKTFRCPLQWSLFPAGEYQPGEWRITSVFPNFPAGTTP